MKVEVILTYRDKETKEIHTVGEIVKYKKARAEALLQAGFVKISDAEEEPAETKE